MYYFCYHISGESFNEVVCEASATLKHPVGEFIAAAKL